jgi:hypothetical protein
MLRVILARFSIKRRRWYLSLGYISTSTMRYKRGRLPYSGYFFHTLQVALHIGIPKEIATFISLERSCDPDTWMYILDNTLVKAKGPGFLEADCRMEHLIRVQKRYLKNKGYDFEKMSAHWSLVSGILGRLCKESIIDFHFKAGQRGGQFSRGQEYGCRYP